MPDPQQRRRWLTREQALQIACDDCMSRGVRVVATRANIRWRLWTYRVCLSAEEGQKRHGRAITSLSLSVNRRTGKVYRRRVGIVIVLRKQV